MNWEQELSKFILLYVCWRLTAETKANISRWYKKNESNLHKEISWQRKLLTSLNGNDTYIL